MNILSKKNRTLHNDRLSNCHSMINNVDVNIKLSSCINIYSYREPVKQIFGLIHPWSMIASMNDC